MAARLLSARRIFQGNTGDQFAVVLHEVDPGYAGNSAFADRVGEDELIAGARHGWPFAGTYFRHVLISARIDELDHDHGRVWPRE